MFVFGGSNFGHQDGVNVLNALFCRIALWTRDGTESTRAKQDWGKSLQGGGDCCCLILVMFNLFSLSYCSMFLLYMAAFLDVLSTYCSAGYRLGAGILRHPDCPTV